jgi:hypothetical protein
MLRMHVVHENLYFFDKEHILISRRYHLHTQPLQQRIALAALRMHTARKEREKNYKKKKSRYSDQFLKTAVET